MRQVFGFVFWLDVVGAVLYADDSRWLLAALCVFGAFCAHVARAGFSRRRREGVL